MLEEVNYLPAGLKLSLEQFFLIKRELEKSEVTFKYAYYNPYIIQVTNCTELYRIIKKVENNKN